MPPPISTWKPVSVPPSGRGEPKTLTPTQLIMGWPHSPPQPEKEILNFRGRLSRSRLALSRAAVSLA